MGYSVFPAPAAAGGTPKTQTFTTSGTWTAPTGVVWANAVIQSGGGGAGAVDASNDGSSGGTSSAFGLTPAGGNGGKHGYVGGSTLSDKTTGVAGTANSGQGAIAPKGSQGGSPPSQFWGAGGTAGACLTTGQAVTPGTGYTITVGAGGAAGTAGSSPTNVGTGGSGYVTIFWTE
jgi:hypothetical protein